MSKFCMMFMYVNDHLKYFSYYLQTIYGTSETSFGAKSDDAKRISFFLAALSYILNRCKVHGKD
jgi:hypothetical protein